MESPASTIQSAGHQRSSDHYPAGASDPGRPLLPTARQNRPPSHVVPGNPIGVSAARIRSQEVP